MTVLFFEVDGGLNYKDTEARAPDGRLGIASDCIKKIRDIVSETGTRLVLYGSWCKDWDFDDKKCTPCGVYLNKKLERKGLHLLDKVKDGLQNDEAIEDWLKRHPNVDKYAIYRDNQIDWIERQGA